jgi:wyosine [tRNA(Phe)-imidazoG37] synthetase (radical SAM superfamily)
MESARERWCGSIAPASICTRVTDRTLRVSFLPPESRVCNFHCTYCPFRDTRQGGWPSPGAITSAVARALGRIEAVDSITISGSGEPTLHPHFGAAVAGVLWARQTRPSLAIRIATNGTTLLQPRVRRVLGLLNEAIVRVDAGAERIDRPGSRTPLGAVVTGLMQLPAFSIESIFVDGQVANTDPDSIRDWLGLLGELRPDHVYVATIARAPSETGARPASHATLERIAGLVRDRTGLGASVVPLGLRPH